MSGQKLFEALIAVPPDGFHELVIWDELEPDDKRMWEKTYEIARRVVLETEKVK